ncbi:hypothetical protein MAM1_0145d06515 [Mucor ambiguus]|uniref:Phosphodiesterase n=1 Tax=Mucor ambiguus TaxID=91626 RepID=A0A0C9LVM3_9FUNG|nr:hypothetical protein MAM1_0145d06515 [Mucor ambiguus]
MIILRHNSLPADDLFAIETIMLKTSDHPYQHALDYSLHGKSRSEVYGFIAGIFKRIGICQTLGTTTSDFLDLLIDIEREYNDNPYHSFYHAVDVAMVLYHMLEEYGMSEYLNQFDLAMLMLAALFHDIGHPGNNNNFEVSCHTERALQYNNLSVLESHSSTIALQLLEKHNYLRHIESKSREYSCPITQQEFKSSIVKMILATDMVCHFTLKDNIAILHDKIKSSSQMQQLFQNTVSIESTLKPLFNDCNDPFEYFKSNHFSQTAAAITTTTTTTADSTTVLDKNERLMMCNILIHAADVSNPCRPWSVFYQQSRMVCVEFFRQGEQELSLGLPVSPNMDQKIANPSKINVGFIDYIVHPYFEALSKLYPKSIELVDACTKNRQEWLDLATETIHDVHDIPSIRATLGTSPPPATTMTIAAGTVQIPDAIMQERARFLLAFKRSASLNNVPQQQQQPQQLLTPPLVPTKRRKSEEVASFGVLRQIHHARSSSISKKRRKSEELSLYMRNQPKMVSFFE